MEKNLYHLSGDERKRLGVEQLPESLGEAIELTAESELVLRTLGEHMFNRYVEIKRQEWDDYRVHVTQWELDATYLSCSAMAGAAGARRPSAAATRVGLSERRTRGGRDRAGDRARGGKAPVEHLQQVSERGGVARGDIVQQRKHVERLTFVLGVAREL